RFADGKGALVPGVCHVDGTGRLQSVEPGSRLYDLVAAFHARTGVPMLINTSFNIAGEPIVETPEDALWCLLFTGLDCCVLGDYVVRRRSGYGSVLDLVFRADAQWVSVTHPVDGLRLDLSPWEWGVRPPLDTPLGAAMGADRAVEQQIE